MATSTNPSQIVISTHQLCKSYGQTQVLHDVDLAIEPGKLIGFLGPNGAGKTTTIRILLGLINASGGEARVFDLPCQGRGREIRTNVGYLPGDVHLYSNLSGRRLLQFLARARRRDCSSEIHRLAELFDLQLDKIVRSYSTGMRQKLGLIQALMHRPNLLILDEPTSGLDPLVRNTLFAELRRVIADGRSVLFSSHSLDEVEELCDEVIILRSGRIVEHQKIETLKQRALRKVEIVFSKAPPADLPADLQHFEQNANAISGTWTGDMATLLDWLKSFAVQDVIIERPELNDLFMTYYAEKD